MKQSKVTWKEMIFFLETYSRKPMRQTMLPPEPPTYPGSASWHFLWFGPQDTHLMASSKCWQGLSLGSPSTHSQKPHKDSSMCSGTNGVSLCRTEHRHRWYVGGDVLSVSALNVASELSIPREENEWGLPEPHWS